MNIEIKNCEGLEYLESLTDKSINLFILDLPYGQINQKWDNKINLNKMWEIIKKKIKDKGQLIFFCTTRFGYELINSNINWFAYDLIWEKKNSVGYLSANKLPLRQHEMIYIFKSFKNNNDINIEYNIINRKYAETYNNYLKSINVKQNDIKQILGNYGWSHFNQYKSSQFSLPTKEKYNKISMHYKVNEQPFYKTYEELIKNKENVKVNNGLHIYNPQKIKGKMSKYQECDGFKDNYGTYKSIHYASDMRYPNSILNYGYDKEKLHPTQKPVELIEWLIKTYSNEGDTVVDFCLGSGSTAIAAINTNRNFKGSELDKEIYKICINRVLKHTEDKKDIILNYDK